MSTVTINDVKSYWDRRPCNIRHGTAPVGSVEWSQQVTRRKYFVEPHIPVFAQFDRWNGRRVLELGCGIGTDTLSFLKAGAQVDAVDISDESIRLASDRTSEYSKVRFFNADIEYFIPGSWKYDLVYAFGVLHHTPRPEDALWCAVNQLKPGGELRIMLYSTWSWKNLFTFQQPEAQGGCPLAKTYSVRQARKLVEKAGFRINSVRKVHIFQWRVKDYIHHKYVKAFPWSILPKQVVDWAERYLGWHLLIVATKPLGWRNS